MLYLITHGEYSDYDHDAIIEVDAPLDLPALEAEYRRVIVQEAPADYGEIYHSEFPPYTERQIVWHHFETDHFIDWLVANHGARRLAYTELNTGGGSLRVAEGPHVRIPSWEDIDETEIVNGLKTRVFFELDERKHATD